MSNGVKKTQAELTAELISFGWQLVGPTQTPSGRKASATCGNISLLEPGWTERLDGALGSAAGTGGAAARGTDTTPAPHQ